jgi:hypothetical protein
MVTPKDWALLRDSSHPRLEPRRRSPNRAGSLAPDLAAPPVAQTTGLRLCLVGTIWHSLVCHVQAIWLSYVVFDVSLMYPDVLGSVLSCHMMPKFACRQLATTRYHWYHEFTMIRKWFAIPQISRYQFYIARLVPMTAVTNVRTTFQAEPSPQAAVHTPQGDAAARDISWDWRYRMI